MSDYRTKYDIQLMAERANLTKLIIELSNESMQSVENIRILFNVSNEQQGSYEYTDILNKIIELNGAMKIVKKMNGTSF